MLCLLREQWLQRHVACDLRLAHPSVVAGNRVEAGVGDNVWWRPHASAPEEAQVQERERESERKRDREREIGRAIGV